MKEIEREVFASFALNKESLQDFGFVFVDGAYCLERPLPIEGYTARLSIDEQGDVDGVILEDGEEFEGFRHQILGSFSASVKEAYIDLLREVRDHCFVSVKPRRYYLLPSNPAIYDVRRGFEENEGYLHWPARKRTHEGDYIFIYSARPFKGIAFLCEVVAVDEAQEYSRGRSYYGTMLHLLRTYTSRELPLEDAMAHGLKTVRFLHEISKETADYFLSK